MKIAVYTCITNNYDVLPNCAVLSELVDFICLTDSDVVDVNSGWKYKNISYLQLRGKLLNRYAKFFPHKIFNDYEYSVYIDGNVTILHDITSLVFELLENHSLALYSHPFRSTIYDEAIECAWRGFANYWSIINQVKKYKSEGFNDDTLFECSIIFRKHDNSLNVFSEYWWHEFSNKAKRDQISLTYSAWKSNTNINNIGDSDLRNSNRYFRYSEKQKKHNRSFLIRVTSILNKIIMYTNGTYKLRKKHY